ncbi:hypothetical protein GEV29_17015 [Aeromicrobium sp. SMF47]|uniref:Uncharacterized protein n=1 Tax=Aeromicrobium yanjiei TaxID=2662028 RepID=A0A5Q2MG89_9ACTN|nr:MULTISPECIES: hypothetical protein [Aeromicrobium]MRJ78236.1 hypothetical protein [Aeromicrobium yanjiei]MRK03134.1 hypothetical protein [Aeromicrobium sp. S22]QGG40701.1 hypothetical protein GEV26_04600 [Aeromicrobium yanjiei]
MTWDAYNRRKESLRGMLAVKDAHRDLSLTELIDATEGGRDAFPTDTDALFELQMTWFQRLSGHMERLICEGQEDPGMVAVTAWVSTAADLPSVRALLDAHRDEPALRKAFAKELAYLATSAGVPPHRGQQIQDSARRTWATRAPSRQDDVHRGGLLSRLRNAIAA